MGGSRAYRYQVQGVPSRQRQCLDLLHLHGFGNGSVGSVHQVDAGSYGYDGAQFPDVQSDAERIFRAHIHLDIAGHVRLEAQHGYSNLVKGGKQQGHTECAQVTRDYRHGSVRALVGDGNVSSGNGSPGLILDGSTQGAVVGLREHGADQKCQRGERHREKPCIRSHWIPPTQYGSDKKSCRHSISKPGSTPPQILVKYC